MFNEATHRIDELRENVIHQQKLTIKEQVNSVVARMAYEKEHAVELLKQQAKQRVNEAWKIAHTIYSSNSNASKADITQRIAEALSSVRFFNGRGYYFIFQMNGVNVMHPLRPELEGVSDLNTQDIHGRYILKEHIELIKAKGGEAFYNWWYRKPGESPDLQFEKIGYGKYFEPLNWFIGTGEYVADVERDIQLEALNWINDFHYGNHGYFFIINTDSTILVHENEDFVNQTLGAIRSENQRTFEQFIAEKPINGDYFEYLSSFKPNSSSPSRKVSYLQYVEDWDWVVGTGFYLDDLEVYLQHTLKELQAQNDQELLKILFLSILSTVIMMAISLFIGKLIAKRFINFRDSIETGYDNLAEAKDKMEFMAMHDKLTGLPNRLSLNKKIEAGIKHAKRHRKLLALVFVDLDNFKTINDQYGHTIGDKVLVNIANRFSHLLEQHDFVARFGGDEFMFCFPDADNMQSAAKRVEAVMSTFSEAFIIDGKVFTSSCSIGVSTYPKDSETPEGLVRKADIVLFQSKKNQKGSVTYFNADIDAKVQLRFKQEELLRCALRLNELSVVYQPQVNVKTGRLMGVEALLRWSNDTLGNVPPNEFIPIAEEIGAINKMGSFVLRQACDDLNKFTVETGDAINLSVNVSPKQLLQKDFIHELHHTVALSGIATHRLTLEITENVLLDDLDIVAPVLNQLKESGFGLSLDDFGTGYSSMSYLKHLPVSEIKVDKSFVDNLLESNESDTLVKAIIAIGNSCDLHVVAEGVETKSQFEKLLSYGCYCHQGYYFSKPSTMETIIAQYKSSPDGETLHKSSYL